MDLGTAHALHAFVPDCTTCCGEQPARRPAYAKAGLNRDGNDKGFL